MTFNNYFVLQESSEFARMFNGYQASPDSELGGETFVPSVSVDALPTTVDWREKGYVTKVKNQVSRVTVPVLFLPLTNSSLAPTCCY